MIEDIIWRVLFVELALDIGLRFEVVALHLNRPFLKLLANTSKDAGTRSRFEVVAWQLSSPLLL